MHVQSSVPLINNAIEIENKILALNKLSYIRGSMTKCVSLCNDREVLFFCLAQTGWIFTINWTEFGWWNQIQQLIEESVVILLYKKKNRSRLLKQIDGLCDHSMFIFNVNILVLYAIIIKQSRYALSPLRELFVYLSYCKCLFWQMLI